MRIAALITLNVFLVLGGCSNPSSTNDNNQGDIRNVWWKVVSFEPVIGDTITLARNEIYLVLFADSNLTSKPDSTWGSFFNLRGKTDSLCRNTYYGTYQIGKNDALSISPIATTKVWCPKSYTDYLRALEKATSFRVSKDRLTVFHSGGAKKLEFVKQ